MDSTSSSVAEQSLLESYHRFYKLVRRSILDEEENEDGLIQQVRPIEEWLESHDVGNKITETMQEELKTVWKRAERLNELKAIVRSFHLYKVDLTRRYRNLMTESKYHSSNSTESMNPWSQISTKLDELLQNQYRLEQQITLSNQSRKSFASESSVKCRSQEEFSVDVVVHENEKQMSRVEDLLMRMDISGDQYSRETSSFSEVALADIGSADEEEISNVNINQDAVGKRFFLESKEANKTVFTLRPKFVLEDGGDVDSPTTEQDSEISLKSLSDVAAHKKKTATNYQETEEMSIDLFKDEFLQDIWKVQENIFASGVEHCTVFSDLKHTKEPHSRQKSIHCNATALSFSSLSELHGGDCENFTSLIT